MKTIIIFNDNYSKYAEKTAFAGKTAKKITEEWAKLLGFETFYVKAETCTELISSLSKIATDNNADGVIYSYSDCPFLDLNLTKNLIETHYEYKSEYTFADGYPYGFVPEIIDAGTLRILAELTKTTQVEEGKKQVNRESIFNLIKTDINSFDIESIIAPTDLRLFRFAFHCGTKDNFLQSLNLFNASKNEQNVDELCKIAANTVDCLKTVPGFYNIQISGAKNEHKTIYEPELPQTQDMDYGNFEKIVDEIAVFSENAVISLSAYGECFENKDCLKMIEKILSYEGLSVFIETNGLLIDDTTCEKLLEILNKSKERINGWPKIMIAVKIDAFTAQTYEKIHSKNNFTQAVEAVKKLSNFIPGNVYPQFVRMNENEDELENFYRYWNEKSNASGGNLIIQKYDSLAGLLPQRKVADLSPIDRNVCWHLRRDLTILANGTVPPCRAHIFSLPENASNVFEEGIEGVWNNYNELLKNHINQNYCEKCRNCDEYYTFNF